MLIAAVIALCVVLFILALLAPRLSRGPERASHRLFGMGGRSASKAPGPLGRWLSKPFSKSSKAVGKSASSGRRTRDKLPL
ncbi:MAG: hypothetical protein QOH62_31 [Solirubrobacteraceae bacterium]|jgi:hypothetical protein|nr:hypothetical protein [Solirubrobacteraceae bacterium]